MTEPGARILIADDEPALLRMIEMYLGRRGYRPTTAAAVEAAWAAFQQQNGEFDVVVLDATMHSLHLPDFVARLLSINSGLRIVVTSGYPVDMSAVEPAFRGNVTFLQKPFGPETLADTIRSALDQKESV